MSQITVRSVAYQIDGQSYESRLAFDADHKGPRPGLLMAPNWMGVGAGAETNAIGIQVQSARSDITADDTGNVCVDGHVGGTEGTALPGCEVVILFGAGFGYLGAAAEVEAGAGGRACRCGSRASRQTRSGPGPRRTG